MKTAAVFLIVTLALVYAEIDIKAETARVTLECAAANNVSPAQLEELRVAVDKVNFNASPDLKCTSKCVVEKSGVIVDGVLNADKFVAVGVPFGKDEATLRANLERCRPFYKPAGDCEDFWKLYVCFKSG